MGLLDLFGGSRILGVDVGTSSIKVVEATPRGQELMLTGHGIIPRGEAGPAAALAGLLSHYAFSARRGAIAVSGRSVIVRYLAMDPLDDAALAEAIKVEADKYIPFELDEVRLDCQRLEPLVPGATGPVKVVMVAAKRTLIDEQVGLLTTAGLEPAVVDVDAFALGNAYGLRGPAPEGTATALIDVGASKTDVNIRLGDLTLFTREVYLGGDDFDEAIARAFGIGEAEAQRLKELPEDDHPRVFEAVQPVIDDLGHEILLSLQFFENQFGKAVDQVFLSGGSAGLEGLDASLSASVGKPAMRWDPTEALRVGGGADRESLVRDAGRLAVAIGLAARALDPA